MRLRIILFLLLALPSSFLNAQACRQDIEAVDPYSRYTDHGDGTITDNVTGLMWKKCSEGQSGSECTGGTATPSDWRGALQIPITTNTSGGFVGYTDWRLPNIKELASIVEELCYAPAINATVFPNTPYVSIQPLYYWSSSPAVVEGTINPSTWGVDFTTGYPVNGWRVNSWNFHTRLVRTAQ